ncbi:uncharacterized protein LODBEIA_P17790 [Lodderomyces beijingensis]|uniref:DUF2470 domain-containing protein n=1 Tax=Lodderomyces beijingensis TaxID=1775926 RepID=A0ABP0ZHC2_9ASCO
MSDPSARIISHMNDDHQLSLNDYVVVYGAVDPKILVEDSVRITKVDTESIVIEYDIINPATTKTLALYWTDAETEGEEVPVKSFSDIKGKLIAMAKYCANKQGFAMKKLTEVVAPDLGGLVMYPTWIVLLINAYNPSILRNLFANDALFKRIVSYLPPLAFSAYQFTELNALKICIGLAAIHLSEVLFIARPFLARRRAPTDVRLKWYVMNFIEGFTALLRLKKLG